jgi:hypothetical protein
MIQVFWEIECSCGIVQDSEQKMALALRAKEGNPIDAKIKNEKYH